MKNVFKFLILITLTLVSCSKDDITPEYDNDIDSEVISKTVSSRIKSLISSEGEGGITNYATSNSGKSRVSKSMENSNTGLFISQFPLIEQTYNIEIQYDSIITYEIDNVSLDTISTSVSVVEFSRDTLGITVNPYVYKDINQEFDQDFYIGGFTTNDSTDLYIVWEFIGDRQGEFKVDGFERDFLDSNKISIGGTGNNSNEYFITDVEEDINDLIPIFDEQGNTIDEVVGGIFQVRMNSSLVENLKFKLTVYEFYKPEYLGYFGYSDPDWVLLYRDNMEGTALSIVSQEYEIRFQ